MYFNHKKTGVQSPQNKSMQTDEENNDGTKMNATTPELAMMGENQNEPNIINCAATQQNKQATLEKMTHKRELQCNHMLDLHPARPGPNNARRHVTSNMNRRTPNINRRTDRQHGTCGGARTAASDSWCTLD